MKCRRIFLAYYVVGGWQIIKCRRFRLHWGKHRGHAPWSPGHPDHGDVFTWANHDPMVEGK